MGTFPLYDKRIYYPIFISLAFLLGLLGAVKPVLLLTFPLFFAVYGRKVLYALPVSLFFVVGFLRMYVLIGTGEEVREGEGWYVVSIYGLGRGRLIYRYEGDRAVKVKSGEVAVLMGDSPAFPRDEVVVRGLLKGDTLRVYEAYFRKGVRSFYEGVRAMLLKRTLSEDQYNFALSILTGVRELKWEVKRAFYETGVGHVLAISGLHVGLIFLALVSLLRFLIPGTYAPLVASAFVWLYTYAVGFLPSAVRASIFLTLFSLASLLSRPVKPMNVLAISLLLSLMVKPLWVFSPSLWLSYSAVAGLFSVRGRLGALIGASAFSIPFALHYFGRFALLYVPLNLVVIPLTSAFLYSQLLAFVLPYPFTYSAALFYEALERTVVFAHSLHLPALRLTLPWYGVVVYTGMISIFLLCGRYRTVKSAKPR